MTGRADFSPQIFTTTLPLLRDGKLVALAVSAPKRTSIMPEVPTTVEAGLKADSIYPFYSGFFVPSKTPRAIVEKLHQEAVKALQAPAVQERLKTLGVEPMPMNLEQFDKFFRDDVAAAARAGEDGENPDAVAVTSRLEVDLRYGRYFGSHILAAIAASMSRSVHRRRQPFLDRLPRHRARHRDRNLAQRGHRRQQIAARIVARRRQLGQRLGRRHEHRVGDAPRLHRDGAEPDAGEDVGVVGLVDREMLAVAKRAAGTGCRCR